MLFAPPCVISSICFYRLSISLFGLLLVYQGEAYRFAWFGALVKGIWLVQGGYMAFDRFFSGMSITTVQRTKEMVNLVERVQRGAMGNA